MRYMHSQKKFQSYQPKKKSWWPFGRQGRNRIVTQKSEVTGLQYTNPYSRVKKRGIRFPFKSVSAAILFLGWFGLMVYLPFFRISNVSFHGLKLIKQADIESYVRDHYLTTNQWWPKNNYFLVGQGTMKDDLSQAFVLNSIEVKKIFPKGLEITLEEKVSSIIYDNGEAYYLLDQNGTLLKQITLSDVKVATNTTSTSSTILANITINNATSTTSTPSTTKHIPNVKKLSADYDGYPIVFDSRMLSVSEKQKGILSQEVIHGILGIYNALRRNKLAEVKYMTMDDPNAGVTIYNEKAWTLIMSPTADLSTQLENIRIITKDNKPTEYMDVRFGDRVYWK